MKTPESNLTKTERLSQARARATAWRKGFAYVVMSPNGALIWCYNVHIGELHKNNISPYCKYCKKVIQPEVYFVMR